MGIWFTRHLQVLFDCLGRLYNAPVATTMTILVLAISISLPLVLYQIVISLEKVTEGWAGAPRITLFVKSGAEKPSVEPIELGQLLLQNPKVEDVEYISPEKGLEEFAEMPGFSDAIKALPQNPLPPVLVVYPATGEDYQSTEDLALQLEAMGEFETVIFDQKWLHRIAAMVDLVKRGLVVLAVLMGVGILLVIGNTVRLGITNRADEIEIIDQVGGTHGFIRRPFIYSAILQCFFGAILALVITNTTLYLLSKPVARLAALYESDFSIHWVDYSLIIPVVLVAILLGFLAARLTVNRYLINLKPDAGSSAEQRI